MFVVIFRAKTKDLDEEYTEVSKRMQELAVSYGCIETVSTFENGLEITLSYWHDEAAIIAWKKNSEHSIAQQIGRDRWYDSYIIEVCEVKRQYNFSAETETWASMNIPNTILNL